MAMRSLARASFRICQVALHQATGAAPGAAAETVLAGSRRSHGSAPTATWPRWSWTHGALSRASSSQPQVAATSASMAGVDEERGEAERHRLGERARESVKLAAAAAAREPGAAEGGAPAGGGEDSSAAESGSAAEADPRAWRWGIRKQIWDLLEEGDLVNDPRPCHLRIPSFKGAEEAAALVAALPEFEAASTVRVSPNRSQRDIRRLVLEGGKTLFASQPRQRRGLFSTVHRSGLPEGADMTRAGTSIGVIEHGTAIAIDEPHPKVDLFVVGSVAVDPATGARLGKGEGINEIEYALLRHTGAMDDSTLVMTTVRDEQLVDLPTDQMEPQEFPVDVICTPTRVIRVEGSPFRKPQGFHWDAISTQQLNRIKVLRELKAKLEAEAGAALPTGPPEILPPGDGNTPPWAQRRRSPIVLRGPPENGRKAISYDARLYMWNLPRHAAWDVVSEHVAKTCGVTPAKVDIMVEPARGGPGPYRRRSRGMARVAFPDGTDVAPLAVALSKSVLFERSLRAKVDEPGRLATPTPGAEQPTPGGEAAGAAEASAGSGEEEGGAKGETEGMPPAAV